jgi:hypothetical protein
VVLHPLFLLAPQFMTTRSLVRAADVSLRPRLRWFSETPNLRRYWRPPGCSVKGGGVCPAGRRLGGLEKETGLSGGGRRLERATAVRRGCLLAFRDALPRPRRGASAAASCGRRLLALFGRRAGRCLLVARVPEPSLLATGSGGAAGWLLEHTTGAARPRPCPFSALVASRRRVRHFRSNASRGLGPASQRAGIGSLPTLRWQVRLATASAP